MLIKKEVPNPVSHNINISLGVRSKGWRIIHASAAISAQAVCKVQELCLEGFIKTLACSTLQSGKNQLCQEESAGGEPKLLSPVSGNFCGNPTETSPCVWQSRASGSSAGWGWWIQRSSERSRASGDYGWLSHEQFVVTILPLLPYFILLFWKEYNWRGVAGSIQSSCFLQLP